MTELKTLQNIELPCIKDGGDTYIDISKEKDIEPKDIIVKQKDLKNQAIQWTKSLETATPDFKKQNDVPSIQRWIRVFFNLTDKDLK